MPNHWHLGLYLRAEGGLPKFMQRITLTHTQRRVGAGRAQPCDFTAIDDLNSRSGLALRKPARSAQLVWYSIC
jgi:hypothetical protein